MQHRFTAFFAVLFVVTLLLVSSLGTVDTQAAAPTRNAQRTITKPSVTAGGNLTGTISAYSTHISATTTAFARNLAGTATALKGTILPSSEADTAITSYAFQVLGTSVKVVKAGGISANIIKSMDQTTTSKEAQDAAANLAVKSYGAILSNGAATLSYGSGTVTGDISLDVQDASLGIYSLLVNSSSLPNDASALALAKLTYPNLGTLPYTAYPITTGYAWYSYSDVPVVDPVTHKVVITAQAVILYVVPGKSGKATITASVGRGEFASVLAKP